MELDGWRPDPFGMHEERLFKRGEPTPLVRDGGIGSVGPLPSHAGAWIALPDPPVGGAPWTDGVPPAGTPTGLADAPHGDGIWAAPFMDTAGSHAFPVAAEDAGPSHTHRGARRLLIAAVALILLGVIVVVAGIGVPQAKSTQPGASGPRHTSSTIDPFVRWRLSVLSHTPSTSAASSSQGAPGTTITSIEAVLAALPKIAPTTSSPPTPITLPPVTALALPAVTPKTPATTQPKSTQTKPTQPRPTPRPPSTQPLTTAAAAGTSTPLTSTSASPATTSAPVTSTTSAPPTTTTSHPVTTTTTPSTTTTTAGVTTTTG